MLWAFGFVGVFFTTFHLESGWNVLMTIGMAGILALPFMFLKPGWRFLAGTALLVIFQFAVLKNFEPTVLAYGMGGYAASLSWAGLLLISSILIMAIFLARKKIFIKV